MQTLQTLLTNRPQTPTANILGGSRPVKLVQEEREREREREKESKRKKGQSCDQHNPPTCTPREPINPPSSSKWDLPRYSWIAHQLHIGTTS